MLKFKIKKKQHDEFTKTFVCDITQDEVLNIKYVDVTMTVFI